MLGSGLLGDHMWLGLVDIDEQFLSKNLPSTFHLTFCSQTSGMCYEGTETSRYFRKQTLEHCYIIHISSLYLCSWTKFLQVTKLTFCVWTALNIFQELSQIYLQKENLGYARQTLFISLRLRQEVFTFHYYSLEPSSTVPQGPNIPAISNLWLKSSDSQGQLVSLRTRYLRAELKLYLSPYS